MVYPKWGDPNKKMVMEKIQFKMDDWVPLFQETTIWPWIYVWKMDEHSPFSLVMVGMYLWNMLIPIATYVGLPEGK